MTEEIPPGNNLPAGRSVRWWPPHREPPADQRRETSCEECDLVWWVDRSMAGFRFRCECGAWVEVPVGSEDTALVHGSPSLPVSRAEVVRETGFDPDVGFAQPPSSFERIREIPTNAPMGPNTLRHASVTTRRRWHNRGFLEMAGIIAAFLAPGLVLFAVFDVNRDGLIWLPVASFASGLLVLLVGFSAPHYTFGALRPAKPIEFGEAALIGLSLAALAIPYAQYWERMIGRGDDYLRAIEQTLGLPWTLVLIGFFPAIFEEIAFRGLLQGRLSSLYGRTGGILLSGTAFALAHGVTLGFPFHVFAGFYLGWLRARTGSLYPGMITHFLYNGAIVLAMT